MRSQAEHTSREASKKNVYKLEFKNLPKTEGGKYIDYKDKSFSEKKERKV